MNGKHGEWKRVLSEHWKIEQYYIAAMKNYWQMDEFAYLLQVFIQNGYPEKVVYRMLYEENRKEQEREIDFKHTFYVPYHVRATKLY